jgi:Holliday junction resolvasome RuvABC endonuclease subunit
MQVIGIDVGGKRSAWAYKDEVGEEGESFDTKDFVSFERKLSDLFDIYRPDIVYVGKPNTMGRTSNYNVTMAQMKLIGILCLVAQKRELYVIEINDSSARATLFPGFGTKKKEVIMEMTGIKDPDLNDATVFARAGYILTKKENPNL